MNVALFGKTAKDWRNENPELKGNIRDYASIEQLIVMVNLENMNANFIEQGLEQRDRVLKLNHVARKQLETFLNNKCIDHLKNLEPKEIVGGEA